MRARFWVWFCVAVIFVSEGSGKQCYKCHQTTKECNNGVLDKFYRTNCSAEERCAVLKYETTVTNGVKVQATIRDCETYAKEKMHIIMSNETEQRSKILNLQWCDESMCNTTYKLRGRILTILSIIIILVLIR